MKQNSKTIYLDYAAATPLDRSVLKAMLPYLQAEYGNPSSLHHKGASARKAVESARKSVATVLGAGSEEIVFTSGGTESCNLAILGAAQAAPRGHIITSAIEHHAVLDPIKQLIKEGWKATVLKVNKEGLVNPADVQKALRKDTVLVSVMYANNEIGTIQPIGEIGKILSRENQVRSKRKAGRILFHTDASSACGSLDINVNKLGVDLLTGSSSKFYGPKGAGFLYVRKGTALEAIVHGGGQEKNLRSGTENVAGIVGLASALVLAEQRKASENLRLSKLQAYAFKEILSRVKNVIVNGTYEPSKRLANNLNFTIPGIEGEALMLYLDSAGMCVSTGSACATGSTDASHVLLAIGRSSSQAQQSIRVSLGKDTTLGDIKYFLKALYEKIQLLK